MNELKDDNLQITFIKQFVNNEYLLLFKTLTRWLPISAEDIGNTANPTAVLNISSIRALRDFLSNLLPEMETNKDEHDQNW